MKNRVNFSALFSLFLRTTGSAYRGLFTAKLPDVPYDYGALQPAISGGDGPVTWRGSGLSLLHRTQTPHLHSAGQIMELHHKKHHQAYVNNYNAAMEQYKEVGANPRVGGFSHSACSQPLAHQIPITSFPRVLSYRRRAAMTLPRVSSSNQLSSSTAEVGCFGRRGGGLMLVRAGVLFFDPMCMHLRAYVLGGTFLRFCIKCKTLAQAGVGKCMFVVGPWMM